MSAHPLILIAFVLAVRPGDPRAIESEYRAAIAHLGYPDFAT